MEKLPGAEKARPAPGTGSARFNARPWNAPGASRQALRLTGMKSTDATAACSIRIGSIPAKIVQTPRSPPAPEFPEIARQLHPTPPPRGSALPCPRCSDAKSVTSVTVPSSGHRRSSTKPSNDSKRPDKFLRTENPEPNACGVGRTGENYVPSEDFKSMSSVPRHTRILPRVTPDTKKPRETLTR